MDVHQKQVKGKRYILIKEFSISFFQYPYLDYLKNKKVPTKTLSVLLYRSPCVPLFVNLLKTTKSVQKQSDSIFQLKNESQFSNF